MGQTPRSQSQGKKKKILMERSYRKTQNDNSTLWSNITLTTTCNSRK